MAFYGFGMGFHITRRVLIVGLTGLIGLVGLIGVAGLGMVHDARGQEQTLRDVRVGIYGNKPKIFLNEEGRPDGVFVGVLEAIAERSGWQLTWVPCQWSECLDLLEDGRIDLMPDVAYSQDRRSYLDFHGEEVLESWSQVFVTAGSGIDLWSDLDGKRVAILRGSIQGENLERRFTGFGYDVDILETDTWDDAFAMVRDGEADAAIPNHFFGNYHFRDYGLDRTPIVFDAHSLYFATRRGANEDLLAAIDAQLAELKAEPESPYYTAVAQWMERPPPPVLPRFVFWALVVGFSVLAVALGFIRLLQARVRARTHHLALANRALRQSEEKFRKIFENNAAVKLIVDPTDGRIVEANEAAVDWFGWPRETLMAMRLDELTDTAQDEVPWYRESDVRGQYEIKLRRANDVVAIAEVFTAHVQFNSTVLLHVIAHDITSHRELEGQVRQMQKMESIGRLAGGVAHDFNNYLSVIIGHSELALNQMTADSRLQHHMQEILQAANRSKAVTQQLMAFARQDVMRPVPLDLNDRISGMLNMLGRLIGENIELVWRPDPDAWPVFTDPSQVDQILANLCVNARDAIDERGHVVLETSNVEFEPRWCEANPGYQPGAFVRITVSDDGSGMDRETLDNIFEPFFTTKGVGQGTGLGLATVYGIVRQNNGFINVYSEPGLGTTFRVYMPRHGEEPRQPTRNADKPASQGGGETILVVDDESAIVDMTRMALTTLGYNVLSASSPKEALAIAAEQPIQLLVTDVVMPEMNGRELADRLLQDHPDMACLFMSGYTENILAHKGVLGADVRMIQKPFTLAELSAAVRNAIRT